MLCPNALCGYESSGRNVAESALCARCRQVLPAADGAAFPTWMLALCGSERCGQTTWLVRGLDQITKEATRYRFPIAGQEQHWADLLRALSLGKCIPSTPGLPGAAWCLDHVKDRSCQRVYIYDTSGQETSDSRRLARHRTLRHLNGLVLVIDPFGLDAVRRRYGQVIQDLRPPVHPTPQAFGEAQLVILLRSLEVSRRPPKGQAWDIAVAVVVTKLDVLGLYHKLGSETSSTVEEIHLACRKQLAEWGFENMIRALESHFRPVRYFASSPGGRGPFGQGNALLWMLGGAI